MNEMHREWMILMYQNELEETLGEISNQKMWEAGYEGEEPNPHTEHIANLVEYMDILKEKMKELTKEE